MEVGVFYFPTDYGIDIAEPAQALETCGSASQHLPGMSRDGILRLLDNYAPLAAAG